MSNKDEIEKKKKRKEELEKELKEKKQEKVELDEKGKKEAEDHKQNARKNYQELSKNQQELAEQENQLDTLNAELKEKEKLCDKFDQDVREQKAQVEILENEVSQAQKLEEDLNNLVEEKKDENFDAQKKADDYQVDIDGLTEDHAQKVEEENKIAAEIQEEEKVGEQEEKKIEELEKKLKDSKAQQTKSIGGIFGGIIAGIAGLATGNIPAMLAGGGLLLDGISSTANLDEVIAEIEQQLKTSRRNLEQSKQKKRDLADKREACNVEINRLMGERNNMLQLKAACFETSDQINERINACQTNAQQKRNQQEGKKNELKEKQSSLNTAMQNYNDAKMLRESKLPILADLSAKITDGKNAIVSVANQADDFMQKSAKIVSDTKTAVNQVSNSINSIQSQINQLNIPKVAAPNKK